MSASGENMNNASEKLDTEVNDLENNRVASNTVSSKSVSWAGGGGVEDHHVLR